MCNLNYFKLTKIGELFYKNSIQSLIFPGVANSAEPASKPRDDAEVCQFSAKVPSPEGLFLAIDFFGLTLVPAYQGPAIFAVSMTVPFLTRDSCSPALLKLIPVVI